NNDELQRIQLIRLLEHSTAHRQKALTESCHKALFRRQERNYCSGTPLSKDLLVIYTRRSKYKWLIAEGFDVVIAALQKTNEECTRIHGLDTLDVHYTVFTTPDNTKLLGIIAVKGSRKP
ncbi:MAG: hypothetical protein HY737_08575, partial [Candidatus Omnitrophica bacterium]|nr:hypothetical protein [Candidatus Omnitrophota bacterium]